MTDDFQKSFNCEVTKVDDGLGVVFGYSMVCAEKGNEYFDVQGDNIVEEAMLEATRDYMAGDRVAKIMHTGEVAGQIVYGFPITDEICEALDMFAIKSGFIVGMKPNNPEIMTKYRTGELTGFSIGGQRIEEEIVEE